MTPVLATPTPTIERNHEHAGSCLSLNGVAPDPQYESDTISGFRRLASLCGFTDTGLPIAFQLIGRPLAEGQLLSAAHRYEQSAVVREYACTRGRSVGLPLRRPTRVVAVMSTRYRHRAKV